MPRDGAIIFHDIVSSSCSTSSATSAAVGAVFDCRYRHATLVRREAVRLGEPEADCPRKIARNEHDPCSVPGLVESCVTFGARFDSVLTG
jgi:hypothetical protein